MKALLNITTVLAVITLTSCATQTAIEGRMGHVDCEALKNIDHSKMDHSSMSAEMHALHQQCGIKMDMPGGHDAHHGHH